MAGRRPSSSEPGCGDSCRSLGVGYQLIKDVPRLALEQRRFTKARQSIFTRQHAHSKCMCRAGGGGHKFRGNEVVRER